MKIDLIHLGNIEGIPIDSLKVAPVSATMIGDMKNQTILLLYSE